MKQIHSTGITAIWLMLIFIPAFCLITGTSWAQSRVEELVKLLTLEQLMTLDANFTSFFDTPIEKSPGSLYVIPEEVLDFSHATSLADYLAYYVPGVHISEFYDQGPLYSTRGISGGSNTTALFMLDSEMLNTSSGISSNLNLPLLGYADRIEVLNGPCSLLHGSGAVNGFVNILHKNGKDHPGTFASMESDLAAGEVRMETGHGISGSDLGDLYLYLGAVQSDSMETPAKVTDTFSGPSFRTSLNWRKDKFSLTAFAQTEKFETGRTKPFVNIDEGYPYREMDSYALMPKFQSDITDTEDITFSLPIKYFKNFQKASGSDQECSSDKEFQFKANILFRSTRVDDHRIAAGGSASFYTKKTDSRLYDSFNDPKETDAETSLVDLSLDLSWVALSAFLEDTIQLSNRLSLISGIRFDSVHSSNFELSVDDCSQTKFEFSGDYGEEFTPRIGLSYELTPAKILKFMYQEGYNVPATGYYYNWGYHDKNTSFTRPSVYAGLNWTF